MRSFDDLVAEAEAAEVDGWGFAWLDGRATEERPPWGYARQLARRLATAGSARPGIPFARTGPRSTVSSPTGGTISPSM